MSDAENTETVRYTNDIGQNVTDLLTPEKPKALTSTDVRAAIQSHFGSGGEKYAVLFEVRNSTGFSADRSVDAVVMSLWPSLGLELWGMEIKVNRYDWTRELRDPAKASRTFDYFDRWFLVAPTDVARPEELPEPWGWLVPEGGGLRRAREAAKNPNVKVPDRNFLAALLRRIAKTDDAFVEKRVEDACAQMRKVYEADAERSAMSKLTDIRNDAEQWAKVRDLLKQKPDDWIYQDDVVGALRMLMKSGVAKSYSGLRSLMETARRMQDDLTKIADELGLEKEEPKRQRRARSM